MTGRQPRETIDNRHSKREKNPSTLALSFPSSKTPWRWQTMMVNWGSYLALPLNSFLFRGCVIHPNDPSRGGKVEDRTMNNASTIDCLLSTLGFLFVVVVVRLNDQLTFQVDSPLIDLLAKRSANCYCWLPVDKVKMWSVSFLTLL